MIKRSFTPAERFAVYVTHGEKCYLGGEPLDLQSMVVDHIIPESLGQKPHELSDILRLLGLPETFGLNSFENWMPACGSCNRKKQDSVFDPVPLVLITLRRAKAKARTAAECARKTVNDRDLQKALNTLERAKATEQLRDEVAKLLVPLVAFQEERRAPEMRGKVVKLTPLYEVLGEENGVRIIRGPYGMGARPTAPHAHATFNCVNCGSIGAWNGARCVICGVMCDGD